MMEQLEALIRVAPEPYHYIDVKVVGSVQEIAEVYKQLKFECEEKPEELL